MALENIPADLLDLYDIKVTPKTNVLRKFLLDILGYIRNLETKNKELEQRIIDLENV
jgi:hypothetical protein